MLARMSTRYAGAGLGEELFGALSNRELAGRAAATFALASAVVVLRLERAPFALLYAFDLGLRMVLVGTVSYVRFHRAKGNARRADAFWGALFLTLLWALFVLLPVAGVWAPALPRTLIPRLGAVLSSGFDLRVALVALVLLALAVRRARREARLPEEPGPTLYKPVLTRALCVAAFVFFGPGAFAALQALGADEPAAMALTYAASETYPFVATLIDRALHRPGRPRRRPRAQDAA
jgi:hypothetical protein